MKHGFTLIELLVVIAIVAILAAILFPVFGRAKVAAKGAASSSDLEAWVTVEVWHRALDLLHEASHLLHAEARPAGTPDTVHVSATTNAFTMTGGLDGEAVRWTPAREQR